jgi:predicted DNA-binding transcriptional regulator AlpA
MNTKATLAIYSFGAFYLAVGDAAKGVSKSSQVPDAQVDAKVSTDTFVSAQGSYDVRLVIGQIRLLSLNLLMVKSGECKTGVHNLSCGTQYALTANAPALPRLLKLAAHALGFQESVVDAWIESSAQPRVAAYAGGK